MRPIPGTYTLDNEEEFTDTGAPPGMTTVSLFATPTTATPVTARTT
jgi:hypothetical protein